MQADRSPQEVILFCKLYSRFTCCKVGPHHNRSHLEHLHTPQHLHKIFLILRKLQMTVRIKKFHSLRENKLSGFLLTTIALIIFFEVCGRRGSSMRSIAASSRTKSVIRALPFSASVLINLNGSSLVIRSSSAPMRLHT